MNKMGQAGERMAEKILLKNKFDILAKNFHSRFGEIDIIAKKSNLVIFVEVKTRGESRIAMPCESVTAKKKIKIRKTADYFILISGYGKRNYNYRFDIIEIIKIQGRLYIRHLENAF